MSAPDINRLVDIACALRSSQPILWQQFLDAMGSYADDVMRELGRCAPELLVRAQGMSIQATEIATILKDAPKIQEDRQRAIAAKHARTAPQRPAPGQPRF